MSKKVRLLNKKTGKTIELDNGRLSFFTFLLNMRYWFVGLFTIGRPIMGLTGVALIVIAIVFGAVIDDGKGIAAFAAVVYISLGVYYSVNRNKMLIQFYLENGWLQATMGEAAVHPNTDAVLSSKKKPWLAFLLNFLLPGAGLAYLGKWVRAAMVFFGFILAGFWLSVPTNDVPADIRPTDLADFASWTSPFGLILRMVSAFIASDVAKGMNAKARAQGSKPVQQSAPLAQRAPRAVVPAAVPHPPLHDRVPTPFPQAATKGAFCRDCGAPAADSKFCPRCGQPQRPSNICSRCGTQLRVGSTFCAECGAKSA